MKCKNDIKCYSSSVIDKMVSNVIIEFTGLDFNFDLRIIDYKSFAKYIPFKLELQNSNQIYQKYDIFLAKDKLVSEESLFRQNIITKEVLSRLSKLLQCIQV